jgi:hypothetical protein
MNNGARSIILLAGMAACCGNGDSGSEGPTVQVELTLLHLVFQTGVADLNVCTRDGSNCATTDGAGQAVLEGVPANSDVAITVDGSEMFPLITGYVTTEEDLVVSNTVLPQATVELLAGDLTYDASLPSLTFLFVDGENHAAEGYSASLEGGLGQGPYYLNDTFTGIDDTATATGATARGIFVDVDAEQAVAVASGPSDCGTRDSMWSGDTNKVPVPLRDGYMGLAVFVCP